MHGKYARSLLNYASNSLALLARFSLDGRVALLHSFKPHHHWLHRLSISASVQIWETKLRNLRGKIFI